MLSPRAIRLFLRYFDSIDEALSRRLVRRRTWDEEALTFLLTELLDEDSQPDHNLGYAHGDFVHDLAQTDEPISVDVQLDTHSYPKQMERWVTQSDLGLIITYEDQFNHRSSFQAGWLLQAKRLFPSKSKYDRGFTVNSKFDSYDSDQHDRMKRIRDWAECDFIRYLLYCPRPSALQQDVREHLSHARLHQVGQDIFDYTLGLELRDDFLSSKPTTAAGIFVALLDSFPENLLSVHKHIFAANMPLSWFIVSQLAHAGGIRIDDQFRMHHAGGPDHNLNNPIVAGLIRGDADVIRQDGRLVEVLANVEAAQILPAHTLNVRVVNGVDRPRRG
jgi:hypothetical protein